MESFATQFEHPFGSQITKNDLKLLFAPLHSWEERYRQLVILSRQLPPLPTVLKEPKWSVIACENRAWLGYIIYSDEKLHFFAESESRIAKGFITLFLCQIEGKTKAEITQCDLLALFQSLGIDSHLNASRQKTVQALAKHIKTLVNSE